MPKHTKLNIEQSVAKYIADHLNGVGYGVYWHDSKQQQGTGNKSVTIIRSFPESIQSFVLWGSRTTSDSAVIVPALTVSAEVATTRSPDRLGIGESLFGWRAMIVIDGFASDRLEWQRLSEYLRRWLGHPDTRIPVFDYEADLSDPDPPRLERPLGLENTIFFTDVNTDLTEPVRYYLNCRTTATFIE